MERGLSSQQMLAHPLTGLQRPLKTLSIELFPQPNTHRAKAIMQVNGAVYKDYTETE